MRKILTFLLLLMLPLSYFSQVKMLQHRKTISLEDWVFTKGKLYNAQKTKFNDHSWEHVKVPHTYSMEALNQVGYYRGETWYRTNIDIPISMENERIFIRFEGVGHEAEVFVNDKRIGKHIGGYSAFCYEITNEINVGKSNLIAVNVSNEPNFKRIPVNDKLFNHYGGIYRPVEIFSIPKMSISPTFHASPGVFVELKEITENNAKLEIRTHISNKSSEKSGKLQLEIKDAQGKKIISHQEIIQFSDENQMVTSTISIKNPILWHGRKNPYLYLVEATIISNEKSDKVVQNFGLRTFDFDANKGFILNNEIYRLYGVNMHQEWQDVGPALNKTHHLADMNFVEEIGATTLRTAHYQHSDLVYELADQKGILTWAEIPYVNDYSGREDENAKSQLTELIFQNYNHPSIFVWGLWNEVRANKSPDEPCVILTKELNELAHKLDSTRKTISASDKDMVSNMGNITDIQSWNKYFGWYYGNYHDMGKWLDKSHQDFPNRPLSISEYGIGGNIFHQDVSKLEKPVGDYFPEMEQTNYHEITWKIFKDRPYVWGTYIWTMADFSVNVWNRGGISFLNHKGLMTFDRKIKKDAFYFYKANWSQEPVLHIAERRHKTRTLNITNVKVFTNSNEVLLFVNNQKIAQQKQTSDIHVINFENIALKSGENKIQVISKDKKLQDEVIWTLN